MELQFENNADKKLVEFVEQYEHEKDPNNFNLNLFLQFSDDAKKVVIAKFAKKITPTTRKIIKEKFGKEGFKPIFQGMKEIDQSYSRFDDSLSDFLIIFTKNLENNTNLNQQQILDKVFEYTRAMFFKELLLLFPSKMTLDKALYSIEKKAIILNQELCNSGNSNQKSVLAECIEKLVSKPKKTKLDVKEIYDTLINHAVNVSMRKIPELNNLDYETKVYIATILVGEMLNAYLGDFFNQVKEHQYDENINQENDFIINSKNKPITPIFNSKENTAIDNTIVDSKKEKENADQNNKCILF